MCCRWERKVVQLLWKTVWKFLQRLNIELPCESVISLLENSQEKFLKSVHKKNTPARECPQQPCSQPPEGRSDPGVHQQVIR